MREPVDQELRAARLRVRQVAPGDEHDVARRRGSGRLALLLRRAARLPLAVPAGWTLRLGPVWLSAAIRGLGAASGGGSAVKPWSAGAGQSQPTAVAVCADVPSNS